MEVTSNSDFKYSLNGKEYNTFENSTKIQEVTIGPNVTLIPEKAFRSCINLKKVTFKSDKLKRNITLRVTNAAVRSVDFKGGFDKYLKSVKKQKLSRKVQKLKLSIALTA